MAVLSDSFGSVDIIKDAIGSMNRYDNQGPTDEQSAAILTKTLLSNIITLTFNPIEIAGETRVFIALQPGSPEVQPVGQAEFTTAGSSSWVVPEGVTSISAVVIGGGGGGVYSTSGGSGGAGGNLRYSTSISVIPGETLTITRGSGGTIGTSTAGSGGASSIVRNSNSTTLLSAAGGGGGRATNTPLAQNGTSTTIGGTIGGGTGGRAQTATTTTSASGGGGAGGYSGNGGNGGVGAVAGTAGAGGGGGGGGGGGSGGTGGNGGGVGIFGQGTNGTAGAAGSAGGAGSNGSGQTYGGGGRGSDSSTSTNATAGGRGVVRIIWGEGRSYPATNTFNQTTVAYQPAVEPFFGPEEQVVTLNLNISFPKGTFVKIVYPEINYSTIVEVLESSPGSIKFIEPTGFPTSLSAFARIEGMSPTNYPLSFAITKIRSSTRPYNFIAASDFLAANENDPTRPKLKLNFFNQYFDFNTIDNRELGKLKPSQILKSLEQTIFLNSLDKLKIKSNQIFEIKDERTTDSILDQDTSQTAFWRAAGSISGILSLTGFSFDIQIKEAAEPSLKENIGKLNPYNEPGLYDNEIYSVFGQDNIKWGNVENYYIYDLDVLFLEISPIGDRITLFFTNNLFFPKKVFNIGDFARVIYEKYNIDQVVEVLDSTINSITFNTIENFPNDYNGGIKLQLATLFYYPKERVFNELITQPILFENITLPRENLFISEYRPILRNRTVSFFIGRDLSDNYNPIKGNIEKLELYDTESRLPADFIVKVIGENTEIKYDTSLWYQEDLDIITYSIEEINQKILYFEDQAVLLFKKGDYVRIYNPNLNYSKVIEVLESSNRFIIIDLLEDFPGIGDLYIENLTTSVYPQKFVSFYPGKDPETARENLFYFEFLPSLRASNLPVIFDTTPSIVKTDFFRDYIRISGSDSNLEINLLEKNISKIQEVSDIRSVQKLSSAIKVVSDNNTRSSLVLESFKSQTTVRPTTNPVNASERFYYFNLSPGYRYNKTINQGFEIFQDDNLFQTQTLKNINPLLSDRNDLKIESIDRFKTKDFNVIETPISDTLEKNSLKVISFDNFFSVNKLAASVKVVGTQVSLSTETLSSAVTIRETQPFIGINFTEKFITKNWLDINNLTIDFLNKDSIIVRDSGDQNNFFSAFLNRDLFNLRESVTLDIQGNLKSTSSVKDVDVNRSVNFVRSMTILRANKTFDIYEEIEDYNNQFDTVISNNLLLTPKENFLYFKLAPGYRSNSSIQQGFIFDPVIEQKSIDFLQKYEFEGFTGGPTYKITGQDQGITANTVVYYIDDLDILTVNSRSVDSITLYFDNIDKIANPYPAGSFVVVNRIDFNNGTSETYTEEVLESGFNFVKIRLLEGWSIKWIFETITTPYADVYPTEFVKTITAPSKPRELLKYSQIATGYKTNNTLQQGFSFEPDYTFDLSKVTLLERDSTKLQEISNIFLNKITTLEKSILSLNEIYPNSMRLNGRIEISKFGKDFNEFSLVVVPENRGLIIRLKTKEYFDIAAPKKEPIQFWN
jgi:hypothetical protein